MTFTVSLKILKKFSLSIDENLVVESVEDDYSGDAIVLTVWIKRPKTKEYGYLEKAKA